MLSFGTAKDIQSYLRAREDVAHKAVLQRYFQTGPGQYAEGDQFLGIRVPALRIVARNCRSLGLDENRCLLQSAYHEERHLALLILTMQYPKAQPGAQQTIYDHYLENISYINHWDLVDVSAAAIVGAHLLDRDRDRPVLRKLAQSDNFWLRRIAIVAAHQFIRRQRHTEDVINLAQQLVNDPEDLIHKAVGWTLRELAKRDADAVESFLQSHQNAMPRTMLRYAVERFPEPLRKAYLQGSVGHEHKRERERTKKPSA